MYSIMDNGFMYSIMDNGLLFSLLRLNIVQTSLQIKDPKSLKQHVLDLLDL